MSALQDVATLAGDVARHIAAGRDATDSRLAADLGTLRNNIDRVIGTGEPVEVDSPLIQAIAITTAETLRVLHAVFVAPTDDAAAQTAVDRATAAIEAARASFNATAQEIKT